MSVKEEDIVPPITKNKSFGVQAGIFLAGVSGISAIAGFSATLAAAKKQDTKYFNKGMYNSVEVHTTGVNLALRALGWGTIYAISGTGILVYGIWLLSGAENFSEFRQKIGSRLPRITNPTPGENNNFSDLGDLLNYIQEKK